MPIDAPEIIEKFLKENGYDGLFNVEDDFCCCEVGSIAGECGVILADCYAGHAVPVEDGYQWECGPRRGFNIGATLIHDAGAYGQCSHCGRYSDNPNVLSHELKCDCGKNTGWSGSFKRPDADSAWASI